MLIIKVYIRKVLHFVKLVALIDIPLALLLGFVCMIADLTRTEFYEGLFIAGAIVVIPGTLVGGRFGEIQNIAVRFVSNKGPEDPFIREEQERLKGSYDVAFVTSVAGGLLMGISLLNL